MAIKQCEHCGHEIDIDSPRCRNCNKIYSQKSKKDRLKNILGNTTGVLSDKGSKIFERNPKVVERTKFVRDKIQHTYEKSGTKKIVGVARTKTSEKLDVLSGQAMYQLVQERLAEQDCYNDILATKLQEALNRIAKLEKKLK